MRMLKLAVLLAVSAVGAAAQVQQPLEASLRRGADEAVFFVNQPAYVAVFEVIPGQGVQQLFPRSTFQSSKPVEAGDYLLSRPFRSRYGSDSWSLSTPYARPVYMLDGYGRVASYYYTTGWTGSQELSPVRTLLLVASRKPLQRVTSPEGAQFWLQRVVGFRAISNTVYAPESMLTDIVDAVLPMGSTVDDVVVDVLQLHDWYNEDRRMAGQSILFSCPGGGLYAVPAQFFFSSGMFFCPMYQSTGTPATVTPPTGVPADSGIWEPLKLPGRKVPPKTEVEQEGFRAFKRGATTTPAPDAAVEEGFRSFRRGVSTTPAATGAPQPEGFRAYRRGVENPATPSTATIAVGVLPMPVEGYTTRTVNITNSAWVPPAANLPSSEHGYGVGRFSPAGSPSGASTGYGAARPVGSYSGHSTTTTYVTPAPSAPPSPSPSAAQADRSSASRAEVQAARPATSKPIDP